MVALDRRERTLLIVVKSEERDCARHILSYCSFHLPMAVLSHAPPLSWNPIAARNRCGLPLALAICLRFIPSSIAPSFIQEVKYCLHKNLLLFIACRACL